MERKPVWISRKDVEWEMERLVPVSRDFYYRGGVSHEQFWREAAISSDYEQMIREIRQEGARIQGLPLPELTYGLFMIFEKRGSRLEYESVYFERRRRLNTLLLLALLEPNNEELEEELHDTIWTVCGEYTWCLPAHVRSTETRGTIDLFAAETGFTLAEIRLLLGDRLPDTLRARIEEEVEERIFRPYLTGGPFGWETATHNWSAVCAGSIGAAALLMLEPSERLTAMITKALDSLSCYLEGFGEDGACLEGASYWNYGFGYFVYFADLLKRRTSGGINLFELDKVRRVALFQQKCYLHGDTPVNFSDASARIPVQLGLTHYLSRLYPELELPPAAIRAFYTDDHCSRFAPALRNIVWYDPKRQVDGWRDADYRLPDAQWIVSRQSTEWGRFGFAAKGGHNDEPHNHNDIGSFILFAGGQTLIAELGAGEYTADYFGERRYSYDCNGSQGHSVPIVDGVYQKEGNESRAQVLEASADDREVRFRLEMASAYPVPHLSSLVRQLIWRKDKLPSLLLTDEFVFTSMPGSVAERFVTAVPPTVAERQPGSVLLQGEGGLAVSIRYDPARLKPVVTERTYRDHYGVAAPWYTLDFELAGAGLTERVELSFELIITK